MIIWKTVEDAGGKGLALVVDIRDEQAVAHSIEETVKTFGGIDIVINNASAISLTGTEVSWRNFCNEIHRKKHEKYFPFLDHIHEEIWPHASNQHKRNIFGVSEFMKVWQFHYY